MDGGQGSARKLQRDAVGGMEGQTQTEEEGDEKRQERLMEVCEADRTKRVSKHKQGKTAIEGDFILDTERKDTVVRKVLKDHFAAHL